MGYILHISWLAGFLPSTAEAMERQPFQDVSPIKICDFPMSSEFSGV